MQRGMGTGRAGDGRFPSRDLTPGTAPHPDRFYDAFFPAVKKKNNKEINKEKRSADKYFKA